ncbi:MAG TPA: asparagine synthase-related protein, partial [Gammaproteobacteria bacterium]|nr:asparagine synthase-related protein [Gammaproteobacteria bacterium]
GNTSEAVPIALSGGFDSRLLAAATVKAGIPVKLFSFGNRHHPELRRAKAVAEALDQPLEVIPYPADNSIKRLPLHLEALEGTADLATASVANLLEVDLETGAPMIHGFCGDPLAGNHINHITPSEYSDRDGLAGGIMRFYGAAGEHTPERLLSTGVSRQALCDEIRSDLLEGCPLYQSYSAWDFENRQRRYVGSYFAMTGRRFHTIMPFYDPAIFNLWFSIPPIALHGRTLFRSMLARHYPSLARIPHSEESAPIVPNLRHQLADFLRRAPQSMARKLFGEKTAKYLLLLRHRDPYIWSLGNLAAPQQRRYMRTEIDRLGPAMDDVLGLRLADVKVEHLQDHVQALRGLFLTASYAGWLRDRL